MNCLGLYFPNNCSFSISSLGIFPIPLLQYSRTLHWVVLTTGGRKVLLEVRSVSWSRFQWQPFAGFLFSWKNQSSYDTISQRFALWKPMSSVCKTVRLNVCRWSGWLCQFLKLLLEQKPLYYENTTKIVCSSCSLVFEHVQIQILFI